MKAALKYLQQHAEAEVKALESWPRDARYDHVVVIPAYDESPEFFQRLISHPLEGKNALAIIVVNRPDTVAQCQRNQELKDIIRAQLKTIWTHVSDYGNCQLLEEKSFGVLLVDRDTIPIPHRQGVGLARKIGADLASALMTTGQIISTWIHSTDADAHLPEFYFESANRLGPECSAGCYQFNHRNNGSDVSRASQWYQSSLVHYRDGLAQAGSPYAYFTIGSTLVFNYNAYCQARGFPKRSGGEDFYLLNKLAKLGTIASLPETIELEARTSHRVPFGTGPATEKILQTMHNGQPLLSYNPNVFSELGHWLKLATATIERSCDRLEPLNLNCLHPDSQRALKELGIDNCWQHLTQSSNKDWRLRHFHHWFDAFRTLKFIHYLQRQAFAPQPLPNRIDDSAF